MQRLDKQDPFRKYLWEREEEQDFVQSRHAKGWVRLEMPCLHLNRLQGKGSGTEDFARPIS